MSEQREPVQMASFVIANRLGLHARAAALFVQTVTPFDADIFVTNGDQTVNGKSIMGLMMLAAGKGSVIDVEARGPAAEQVLHAIGEIIEDKFREGE